MLRCSSIRWQSLPRSPVFRGSETLRCSSQLVWQTLPCGGSKNSARDGEEDG